MEDRSKYSEVSTKRFRVETKYRTNRTKNHHPVIRIGDLLNPDRCSTLDNLVSDMVQSVSAADPSANFDGVWYSIPVALSRADHLSTDDRWNSLLQRIQKRMQDATAKVFVGEGIVDKDRLRWHCEMFPASKVFVVRCVLKSPNKWEKRLDPVNNRDQHVYEESEMNLPVMDPIYHFYMHCALPSAKEEEEVVPATEVAGPNLRFMDTMYNRWAMQNPAQLRQRILESKGKELGIDIEQQVSENATGKRGFRTSRDLHALRNAWRQRT